MRRDTFRDIDSTKRTGTPTRRDGTWDHDEFPPPLPPLVRPTSRGWNGDDVVVVVAVRPP